MCCRFVGILMSIWVAVCISCRCAYVGWDVSGGVAFT